jgi:hypothetical protein
MCSAGLYYSVVCSVGTKVVEEGVAFALNCLPYAISQQANAVTKLLG